MRTLLLALGIVCPIQAADVLFEDDFKKGFSDRWQIVGLEKTDYRIRDGGLEMRVQTGKPIPTSPMIKIMLPFTAADSVSVSVKVTLLDDFTEEEEFAGVFLLDETGREFSAKKQIVDKKLVFAPGKYTFKGMPGQRGDPTKYEVTYSPAKPEAGPLRILVDRGNAFFQVGPAEMDKDKYEHFFHSAIGAKAKQRGFALFAAGAPEKKAHWVRYSNFRVEKH